MKMTIEEAFFILKHGSSEGIRKYLEAILIVEKENKELKRLLKLAVEDFETIVHMDFECNLFRFECGDCPFRNDKTKTCNGEWIHLAEAEKLLEENENEH